MKNSTSWLVVLVVALGVIIGIFAALYFFQHPSFQKEKPAPVAEKRPVPTQAPPAIRHPLPQPETPPETGNEGGKPGLEKPLPSLNDSDQPLKENMESLFPGLKLESLFILDHFIQRFVLMVDNLPRHRLPVDRLPIRPTPGQFMALGEEGHQVINPENYRRYAPFVRFVDALDAKKVVAVYVHFYPLFQEAYRQLGYPKGYFNDRLIEVIDHLLAAPEIHQPIPLVQHVVHYKFADPVLENLSAGQKILIRMGNDNALKIKRKLREIRRELIAKGVSG